MSVFNAGPVLQMAVESICSQTYTDWELIAINDGSTDESGLILDHAASNDIRITVVHQHNIGLCESLKRAIGIAKGLFLARMDADDISSPTRIERLVRYFDSHPLHVLAGTWAWRFSAPYGVTGVITRRDNDPDLRAELFCRYNPYIHGSVMFRKGAYDKTSGYRIPEFSEEFDLWLQLSEHGKIGMVESCEYLLRQSPDGMSYTNFYRQTALQRLVIKLALERRKDGCERSDWKILFRDIIEKYPCIPDKKIRQLQQYSLGILQLAAGYRERSIPPFLRCIALNRLGAKALFRLFTSAFLGYGIPDSGFSKMFQLVNSKCDILSLVSHREDWKWIEPWLEAMDLPKRPYRNPAKGI
jgi:glycosyltransferase involved in cell wall biosynthesis